MRKLVFQAITGDAAVTAVIPADRWVSAGALDAPEVRPFGVIRIVDATRSVVGSSQPRAEIWVHDERGSYIRIDSVLQLVRTALESAVPMENATHRIVDVEWAGDSPDLVDEGYNTNTRNSGFILTGRK